MPLSGVRVLDCSNASGAFCAARLADLGATIARAGLLAADADVVVVSGTPGALARRGLDPAELLASHPQLIVAAISPFGLAGPRAEWASGDSVVQALGGMVYVNGHPHEAPLRGLGPQARNSAGLHAAIGIVLALLARAAHGRGQLVDVSEHESTVAMLEHVTGLFRARGVVAQRRGALHWSGTFGVVECADGPAVVSHVGDWTTLLEWLKHDGAAADLADPQWEDPERRSAECRHVFAILAAWAARYRVAELVERAQSLRLPFAPVWPLAEVAAHPQLWARRFFVVRDERPAVRGGGPFCFLNDATPPGPGGTGAAPSASAVSTARRRPGTTGDRRRVLDGIRVLDFTWVVAGPVATRVLADHGADVIKVERPDTPDDPERRGGLFGNLNRGKRSIAIDLADPRGVALARELARKCDVVIDNFSPRVLANWGLSHAVLRAADPRLITVRLSGFGATGPLADAVSYGPTLHAQMGFTWHMRHPGGAPAGWGFAFSDMASGYCAALAVLAAIWRRARRGIGCAVDLSQLECLATMLGPLLGDALRGEPIPDAFGNRSPQRLDVPDGIYRCADDASGRDRWCAISLAGEDDWRRFAAAIGAPSWASEDRFATRASRCAHVDALDRLVESWTRPRAAEAVMSILQAAGVAAGLVADARDLAADTQLAARQYWTACADGAVVDGVVPRLSDTPGAVAAPGPRLGEHADEVLREVLGMEQSAVEHLRRAAVVR